MNDKANNTGRLLPDQQYRDRITRDLDRTMLVEAAAGTGKTTCLVARMVALLREGKCRIETLAAVTFTRKAGAELRTRFQLALERAAAENSGQQRARLLEALEHIERCFIGTIHAFCGRLLRQRPVEAGVDPNFVELDETLDTHLRQQAWRDHVTTLITTNDPILPELERLGLKITTATRRSTSLATELDELGLEPAELGPAFLSYAEYSDVVDWPAEPVPLPDLKPCIEALTRYAQHMRSLDLPDEHGRDTLMPKYQLIGRMAQRLDMHEPAQLMELLEQFERTPILVQRNWPGKAVQAKAEMARWNDFVEQYAAPLLLAWREHRYEPVMRAIRPALTMYDRLRRERNALSFQDLLMRTAAMLRDYPEVRRYFRQRVTHLLVDEFQDTDPLQAEVMMLLSADDPHEKDWHRCRPVAGSLFVVGDPKQSIYRFRRADILTYSRVRAIVEAVGGDIVPLTTNFRSIAPVVEWINDCFNNVFPAVANDYHPANCPLQPGRVDGADQTQCVQKLLITPTRRNDVIAEQEADSIARVIRQAIDEKWPVPRSQHEREHGLGEYARAGDFLIVARAKWRLTIYARKLQQYGIPHLVTGGRLLNEVPELELLHVCARAVSRSDDPLALVAVLRSELFGIADTVLYDYARLGGRFTYYSTIPGELDPSAASMLGDAFQRLQTYARWLRAMPAAAALERMAADIGLIARACAVQEGDVHAGSLLKAIELLRSIDGSLTAGDYVEALGRLIEQQQVHDGIPVRPPEEEPVRVMNLHQCKGLEAPFVFLVDPSGESQHDVSVHIDRSGDAPRGYLAVYGPKRSEHGRRPLLAQPPHWDALAAREQQFLDAEAKRLLYVAATRAEIKLVISQRPSGNDNNPWQLFDEYLQSELQVPVAAATAPIQCARAAIELSDWAAEVEAIERRWQAVLRPTYAVRAIKESSIRGGFKPHGAESDGAEWGDVLHTLLQAAMKRPNIDLQRLAHAALESAELSLELIDDAVTTVQRVMASQLWQRACRSPRCLTEAPIARLVSPAESANGLPTVERGVIDLIFQEEQGWVLVDYKSERVTDRDLPALVTYYRPQVDAYAAAWESIVGEQVTERGLFFTHPNKYLPTR